MSYFMKADARNTKPRAGNTDRSARVLDAIDANIVVLDNNGFIVSTNKGWNDFAANNPRADGSPPRQIQIGANYLGVCLAATGDTSENAMRVHDGIRAVLDGRKKSFALEYPCHSPDKQRWFLMSVKPLLRSKPREAVVTHVDITDRRLAETKLRNKQQELNAALLQLQEMAERVKVLLGGLQSSTSLDVKSPLQGDSERLESLSRRELEVLSGLVRGERNSAIATRLQLSRKSVSTYRSRIFEKLKVESNVQLMAIVSKTGALK
jgi:DNA-binding CsgD family transcriptional regulator